MEGKWMHPSSSSEVKHLILAQVVYRGSKTHFHVVDLKAKKISTTPISTLLNEYGLGEAVRLGSFIYNFGDNNSTDSEDDDIFCDSDHQVHLGASYFEFSTSHLLSLLKDSDDHDPSESKSIEWNEGPVLEHDWQGLCCASLGDKIYALGGSSVKWGIGQEFSPQCGQWKPLPQPPDDLPLEKSSVSYPLVPDEKNDRLLVHFFTANALNAYYPKERTWNCLASHFPWRWCATALVDGVLYAHEQGKLDCIVAYDVSNKLWLEVVYSSDFPLDVCRDEFIDMLHLGNDILCLANDPPTFEGQWLLYSNLQFFTFSVKRTNLTQVLVTPVTEDYLPFDKCVKAYRFFAI